MTNLAVLYPSLFSVKKFLTLGEEIRNTFNEPHNRRKTDVFRHGTEQENAQLYLSGAMGKEPLFGPNPPKLSPGATYDRLKTPKK